MSLRERAVRRPNGKIYVPRKGMVIIGFDDDSYPENSYTAVLRTHDVEEARRVARCGYRSTYLTKPELRWLRLGYYDGDQAWVDDDVRGVPAVVFLEDDDPETPDTKED